ncbi:MAG: LD-carboxypeptidase [Muribaculaceae bacterium]|nr:LD-carboxypeptidase [Muribaculaceae bacterium]
MAVKNPKAPQALKPGDKIAILSPASTPRDTTAPARAAEVLRQWGFEPVVSPQALNKYHMYAGTIEERRADLLRALRDKSIKAIIATRGGYGSAMLIDDELIDAMKRNPKWLVGYSDITSLHSAETRAGNMSLHANMGGALAEKGANDSINLLLRDALMGERPAYTVPANPFNRPGMATGIVLGGNMSVFTSNFSGSKKYDFLDRDYIKGRDIILFFEDVGESLPRVASMLTQLHLKGVLSQVKGIIVGRFTEYTPASGYESMHQMLSEYILHGRDIPVCFDFPVSHDESWNFPIIEGCEATLNVTPVATTLQFK